MLFRTVEVCTNADTKPSAIPDGLLLQKIFLCIHPTVFSTNRDRVALHATKPIIRCVQVEASDCPMPFDQNRTFRCRSIRAQATPCAHQST
jgi:hypothetical protein